MNGTTPAKLLFEGVSTLSWMFIFLYITIWGEK